MQVDAIKLKNNAEPMMITWDTGRRCNYDCTYCAASRHDNHSAFHSLEEYKQTFNFIKKYVKIYENSKSNPANHCNINFTGGEPTLNPEFWNLVDYIKQDTKYFNLSLTTNGAWNKKFTKKIKESFFGVTVSYHSESHDNLKKLVIENILNLKSSNIWLQVNIMLHVDYFDECVEVYNYLKSKGVKVNPRPIGDGNEQREGWFIDENGTFRRTSHVYSQSQKDWFFKETGLQRNTSCSSGDEFGRGCCGGRCIQGLVDEEWQNVNMIDTYFKNWYCSVNWYFLHIDQHTGLVYHHQTCQAKFNNKKGSIGCLNNTEDILDQAKNSVINNYNITCPNTRCGCGMCIPKAKDVDVFLELKNNI